MKIAIVNQHPQDTLGGSEIQCDIIAREITALGHQVVFIAPNGLKANYSSLPYPVIALPESAKEIAEACCECRPDIVYWRFNKRCFRPAVHQIRSNGRIPVVFAVSHINDLLPWAVKSTGNKRGFRLSSLKRRVRARWHHGGFRWVDAVVTLNREFLQLSPVSRRAHIPNSMRTDAIQFDWPRPYITWIANVKAAKRPELCVNLAERLSGIDVLMVGAIQGPYAWVADRGKTPSNFYYLGPKSVQEASGIIAGAQCLVHTCMPEGFGNNFIQAWLQRTPVVSYEFDPGGLLREEGFGLCSEGDFDRFVHDVETLLADATVARHFADKAHTYAMRNFVPSRNVKMLETFLLEIAS
jgi:glycosyltransferase involved in cell wall biosynthesis